MVKLGVNIDHIATLREARKIGVPDVIDAALICEKGGADGITVHLREDRRHIQDGDVYLLRKTIKTKLNLEISIQKEIVEIACSIKPDEVCIVPEKRQELTTEGGLDIIKYHKQISKVVEKLKKKDILVSLFIDPVESCVQLSKKIGADAVELHTGSYANAKAQRQKKKELEKLIFASKTVIDTGLILNAGHGLDYNNVCPVANIKGMNTLNIGFSIVAKALFTGLYNAVKEMKLLIFSPSLLHQEG